LFAAACGAHAKTPTAPCDGDVVVSSDDGLRAAAACQKIGGSLTIRGAAKFELGALQVTDVGGDLVIGPTFAVDAIELPTLARVGGVVHVISNGSATDASLPALAHAGGLEVAANVSMAGFTAPALVSIDHDLVITGNAVLENVDFSALARIGGAVRMTDNPALSLVEAPNLPSLAPSEK
jgi:hypothetical protein